MSYEGNCRLGDLFTSRREKGRAGLPTLSVTLNDGLVNREDLDRKQETSISPEQHLLVKPGDIAYNMMRMWQGAFGLAEREGLVSPAYVVLEPTGHVVPRYAEQLLQTPRLRYLLWAYSYGLTEDRLRLYFPDFCKIPVRIPDTRVQESIAEGLSKWDQAIMIAGLQITNCQKEISTFQQRLLFATSAGELPSKRVPLCQLARFCSGATPSKEKAEFWNGNVPWVSAKDMKSLYVGDTELRITEEAKKRVRVVPPGSVLVLTRGMTLLHTLPICIACEELAFNQDVKGLLPTEQVSGEFLAHILRAHERQLLDLVDTAGHGTGRLDTNKLKNFLLPVPPRHVQERFIRYVSALEQKLKLLIRHRELLRIEKRALMQKLLSGKRRVHTPATEAEASTS